MKRIDLKDNIFGKLKVIGYSETIKKFAYWNCLCDCGSTITVRASSLRTGNTISCGCFRKEVVKKQFTKHGLRKTLLYNLWANMKQRCTNSKNLTYKNYGGRGITLCDEWLGNPENFINWALTNGYKKNYQIDRLDNNLGYTPHNCRFVIPTINCNNKRNNRLITIKDKTLTAKQWADIYGINYKTFHTRLSRGWTGEKLLTQRGD